MTHYASLIILLIIVCAIIIVACTYIFNLIGEYLSGQPPPTTLTSPTSIDFDASKYAIEDVGFVTVVDPTANIDNAVRDTVSVQMSSSSDTGFTVSLTETDVDSDTFTNQNTITFTSGPTTGTNELHVDVGDTVTAEYSPNTDTATIFIPGGFGAYPSAADPVRFDTDTYYIDSAGWLKILDAAANTDSAVKNTITANVYSNVVPSPGIPVTLLEDDINSGTFTSINQIWFTRDLTTDASIPRIQASVGMGAISASYQGNTASVMFANPPLPVVGNPVDVTVRLACDDDTDVDGLCDTWETGNGLVVPKQDGNEYLVSCVSGATYQTDPSGTTVCPKPDHKDVYVEIDWMTGHVPDSTVINNVVTAFQNAPVNNVDGTTGINLHLFKDENVRVHIDQIPMTSGDFANPGFDEIKKARFGTAAERTGSAADVNNVLTAKRQAFHYVLFIHQLSDALGSSGTAEVGGNDVIISLGGFTGGSGSLSQKEGTLMHELGHNLNLNHGGGAAGTLNCKPIYLSVMTYAFQFPDLVSDRPLDFSRASLTPINEASLSELVPVIDQRLNPFTGQVMKTVIGGKDAAGNNLPVRVVTTGERMDWNNDGDTDDEGISSPIHFMGTIQGCDQDSIIRTAMANANDWVIINLAGFRTSSEFADGMHMPPSLLGEVTDEIVKQMQSTHTGSISSALQLLMSVDFVDMATGMPARDSIVSHLDYIYNLIRSQTLTGMGGAIDELQQVRTDIMALDIEPASEYKRTAIISLVDNVIDALTAASTPPPIPHDAPEAIGQYVITSEDHAIAITLEGEDLNNNISSYTVVTGPSSGSLSGTAPNVTYTPDAGYTGPDEFTFIVEDSTGLVSEKAIVSIDVVPNITHMISITAGSAVPGCESTNSCFAPASPIFILPGDTVTWTNDDSTAHTITSGTLGEPSAGDEFDSGILPPPGSFSHTFTSSGTFDYFDMLHPWITGKVIVHP